MCLHAKLSCTLDPSAAATYIHAVFAQQQATSSCGRCTVIYELQGTALQTVMIYANSHNTEIRAKLKLRSTIQGANNRLDVESIVSFDKADGISTPVLGEDQSNLSTAGAMLLEPCVASSCHSVQNCVICESIAC